MTEPLASCCGVRPPVQLSEGESHANTDRARLIELTRAALKEKGFRTEFSHESCQEAEALVKRAQKDGASSLTLDAPVEDCREDLFVSIDNDDTRDIDQLQTVKLNSDGDMVVRVAISDVAPSVLRGSAMDTIAEQNTVTLYTPANVWLMLPSPLSYGVTSLVEEEERNAVVVEIVLGGLDWSKPTNELVGSTEQLVIVSDRVFIATVRNRAKLAYSSVGRWLEGEGECPTRDPNIQESLRLQDRVGLVLKRAREIAGALSFGSSESYVEFSGDKVTGLVEATQNRANELIANFMIAANSAVARFLERNNSPVIQRVVSDPQRWTTLVALAESVGHSLPSEPDSLALRGFLEARKLKHPEGFNDLSTTVIKLMGKGKYTVSHGAEGEKGHFGLAVTEYSHTTAPNRRYIDLVTHRLLYSVLTSGAVPGYSISQLEKLVEHCSQMQSAAKKVERMARKAAVAVLLESHIGSELGGLVTGASRKGVWVRLDNPPVEGKVVRSQHPTLLHVGDRVVVRLEGVSTGKGHIDLVLVQCHADPGAKLVRVNKDCGVQLTQ